MLELGPENIRLGSAARDRDEAITLVGRAMVESGFIEPAYVEAMRGREKLGAGLAIATAVPLAYLTLRGRRTAMRRIGQTKSGLIEDAVVVASGVATVAAAVRRRR